jgi:hypothetical protein
MNKLFPIVLIAIAVAGVTGVEFAGNAMAQGGGDPCPDPGHCTCTSQGVLHDPLLQFSVNDGCFKCGVTEYNPDGLCANPP